MTRIRTILFDLDTTLADRSAAFAAWRSGYIAEVLHLDDRGIPWGRSWPSTPGQRPTNTFETVSDMEVWVGNAVQ